MHVLDEFGFGSIGLTQADLEQPNQVIQLGVPPVRIDIITSVTGISWEEVALGSVSGPYGDLEVKYIGRNELIRSKRAAGRQKDLADLEALGEM